MVAGTQVPSDARAIYDLFVAATAELPPIGLVIRSCALAVNLVGIDLAPVALRLIVRRRQDEVGLVIGAAHLRLNVVSLNGEPGLLGAGHPTRSDHEELTAPPRTQSALPRPAAQP